MSHLERLEPAVVVCPPSARLFGRPQAQCLPNPSGPQPPLTVRQSEPVVVRGDLSDERQAAVRWGEGVGTAARKAAWDCCCACRCEGLGQTRGVNQSQNQGECLDHGGEDGCTWLGCCCCGAGLGNSGWPEAKHSPNGRLDNGLHGRYIVGFHSLQWVRIIESTNNYEV
jgi:hypothetical protein